MTAISSDLQVKYYSGKAYCYQESLSDGVALLMVQIPAGEFLMGSPADESDRRNNESPQHLVKLPRFFMAKYPVTQAQWSAVAQMKSEGRDLTPNPSRFNGGDRPVERVSWHDAMEFCARLSTYTGRSYTLPSEAQWEYACRAGTTTPFHFGETITTDLANYCGVDKTLGGTSFPGAYGRGSLGEYRKETTSVGAFPANDFGLYDMHGNVWEWCLDYSHYSYQDAPENGSAWLSSDEGADRLLRGGSWNNNPRNCGSASRNVNPPDNRNNVIGFRVVSLPQDSG